MKTIISLFSVLFLSSDLFGAGVLIDGGINAGNSSFPSVVKISTYDNDVLTNICTGTLVAPDIVLTAAHCINLDPGQVQKALLPGKAVRVLRSFSAKPFWDYRKQCINLRNMVALPIFERMSAAEKETVLKNLALKCAQNKSFDIAFLQLDKALGTPSVLGCRSTLAPGTEVMIAGYGKNDVNGNPQNLLQFGGNNLVQTQRAQFTYTLMRQDKKQFTNKGDSGGPLFIKGDTSIVFGVTSAGESDKTGKFIEADFAKLSSPSAFAAYNEIVRATNAPESLKNILMGCLR